MEAKQTTKEEYLRQFLADSKPSKGDTRNKKKPKKRDGMKVIDNDEYGSLHKKQSDGDDDDEDVDLLDAENMPVFVDNAESSKFSAQQRMQALLRNEQQDKGKSIESSSDSDSQKRKKSKKSSKKRKRHDSDSEPDDEVMREAKEQEKVKRFKTQMKNALGMEGEEDANEDNDDNEHQGAVETVHRDEFGKKIDISKVIQEKLSKKEQVEELLRRNQERIDTWGKGMKQKEDKAKAKAALEKKETYEGDYSISKQADLELMKQERFNDPMQHLIQKQDLQIAQAQLNLVNKPICRLKCRFPPITNRFDIPPGHMWDGVDRGNGAEKRYFNMVNTKKDKAAKAHEYSTLDL